MSRLSNDAEVLAEAVTLLGPLGVIAQGTNVVDVTAATALNPTAPVAVTVPTPAGTVAVLSDAATDLDDAFTAIDTLRDETVTYEVAISALILDVAEIRTKVNAILSSLEVSEAMAT
jgi:hypothetical protein